MPKRKSASSSVVFDVESPSNNNDDDTPRVQDVLSPSKEQQRQQEQELASAAGLGKGEGAQDSAPNWWDMLERLQACEVVVDPELSTWVEAQRQRLAHKSNTTTLSTRQRAALAALGVHLKDWNAMCQKLEAFVEEHGHIEVDDKDILQWMDQQRHHPDPPLNPQQLARLQAIPGWDPVATEQRFQTMLSRLAAYKDQCGDCSPQQGQADSKLVEWVQQLRARPNSISAEHKKTLQELGFWSKKRKASPAKSNGKDQAWEAQYHKLQAYWQQHGHSNPPLSNSEYKSLRVWVNTQRTNYRLKRMPQHRIDKLEAIQFAWSLERNWNEQFQRLKDYQQEAGHCHVVPHTTSDPNLVQWVSRQRNLFKTGQLSQERIESLESIGFLWDATGFRGNNKNHKTVKSGKKTTPHQRLLWNKQKLQALNAQLQTNQEELDRQHGTLQKNGDTLEFLLQHFMGNNNNNNKRRNKR